MYILISTDNFFGPEMVIDGINGINHQIAGVIAPMAPIAPVAPNPGGVSPNSPDLAEPTRVRSQFIETWLYQSLSMK